MIVEIRIRRLQHVMSVCVKRRHGATPAWSLSAGEVLQKELDAAAGLFCFLLLLLFQVLLLHDGIQNAADDVPERIASQRQRCLTRARDVLHATLAARFANPRRPENSANRMQRSNIISPINGSTIICFKI